MKKVSLILKKWKEKSKSKKVSSCSGLITAMPETYERPNVEGKEVVFVGSSRKRYMINAAILSHPLLNALIDRSSAENTDGLTVQCEVVLFDHLLWMIETDPDVVAESMEELIELYSC